MLAVPKNGYGETIRVFIAVDTDKRHGVHIYEYRETARWARGKRVLH